MEWYLTRLVYTFVAVGFYSFIGAFVLQRAANRFAGKRLDAVDSYIVYFCSSGISIFFTLLLAFGLVSVNHEYSMRIELGLWMVQFVTQVILLRTFFKIKGGVLLKPKHSLLIVLIDRGVLILLTPVILFVFS